MRRGESKNHSLRHPTHRHLGLPPAHSVQIQMSWLPTIDDGLRDIRCQSRQAKHFGHPAGFQFELAGKFGGIGHLS
jgi:hypothetical protein